MCVLNRMAKCTSITNKKKNRRTEELHSAVRRCLFLRLLSGNSTLCLDGALFCIDGIFLAFCDLLSTAWIKDTVGHCLFENLMQCRRVLIFKRFCAAAINVHILSAHVTDLLLWLFFWNKQKKNASNDKNENEQNALLINSIINV